MVKIQVNSADLFSMAINQNLFRQTRAYQAFMSELRTQMKEVHELVLAQAVQSGSRDLSEQFHRVKGSAGLFGYDAMGEIAAAIEQKLLANSCSLPELKAELERFEQEVRRVIDDWPEKIDG